MNFNIYYFINEFDKNEIEKLSTQISLIYRNYNKKNEPNELRKLVNHCKNNGRKVYISNNLKDALKYNFNGLYIPSFNKKLVFNNIVKKNFELIGSAHNVAEIKLKERQGCSSIFLSPIFKSNKNKKILGVIKTNLLKNFTKKKIILLGGVHYKNLKRLKVCSASGVASVSWIKKNGPSINTGPF